MQLTMKIFFAYPLCLLTLLNFAGQSLAAEPAGDPATEPAKEATEKGMERVQSPYSVEETADRFEAAVREKGIKVFARYDHGAAATEFDQKLRPVVTLAFGNPKYGSPFMAEQPEAGIDFPPKAVVYEDDNGSVWLAYNTSEYLYNTLFARHGLSYPEDHIAFFEGVINELVAKTIAK